MDVKFTATVPGLTEVQLQALITAIAHSLTDEVVERVTISAKAAEVPF